LELAHRVYPKHHPQIGQYMGVLASAYESINQREEALALR
jgi:hypothetical protein